MKIAELRGEFDYGLAVIADDHTDGVAPDFSRDMSQLAVQGDGILLVRVQHGQEREATVRVWNSGESGEGTLAYESTLHFPSGVVWLRDVPALIEAEVRLSPGSYKCRIYVDQVFQATSVDIHFTAP